MLGFVVRRLAVAALLVLGLLTLLFFLLRLAPGDPLERYIGPDVAPGVVEHLRRAYGLDQSLVVQYGRWLRAFLLDFDLGISLTHARPVRELLGQALPNTLILGAWALVVRIGLGIVLGIAAAARRDRPLDRGITLAALFVYSMPTFWIALMVLLVFAFHLHWLPAGQMVALDHDQLGWAGRLADSARHLVLPVFVLGVGGAAATARYMRASMLDVLEQDYVRTARAKGLRESQVLLKHALRNALMPIVTLLGLSIPSLVGGALIVEYVFSWPGMGRLTIQAIGERDYPVILATTFVSAVVVVAGNLLADVLYALVDPRVRVGGRS